MIDLHVHTIYSDGEYEPLKVLAMCKKTGINTVAITDHNSMEGSKIAIKNNPYKDLTIISGVELGAKYSLKGANLHILGYNINLEDKNINDVTCSIMNDNIRRVKSIIDLLKRYFDISFETKDLEPIFESVGNVGRPEIAKLCVKYGYTQTVREAFIKYLEPVDDKVIRKVELTDKECIDYIKNAGGISCLAHPITLKQDIQKLREYIYKLAKFGLSGVEIYHSKQSTAYSNELLKIANEFNLLTSAGSDYHGKLVKPDVKLGFSMEERLNANKATILTKILR